MRVAHFVGVCIVAVIPHNGGQAVPGIIPGLGAQDVPPADELGALNSNALAKAHEDEDLKNSDADNVLKPEIPKGGFGLWSMLQLFTKKSSDADNVLKPEIPKSELGLWSMLQLFTKKKNDTDNVVKQEKPNDGFGLWPLLNLFAKDYKGKDVSKQKIPGIGENGWWSSWFKEDAKEEKPLGNSTQSSELANTGEKLAGGRAFGDDNFRRRAAGAGLYNRQRDPERVMNAGRNANSVLNTVNAVIDQIERSLIEVRRFVDFPFPELKENIANVYMACTELLAFILRNLPFMT